jgi:hypothetical protein
VDLQVVSLEALAVLDVAANYEFVAVVEDLSMAERLELRAV